MPIAANYPTVAPSLDLDFANSQSLDPRISFTRAGTGTYYDGETSAVAEQNLLLRSQEFDNASWNKQFSTVTANNTTAPDATTTAELIAETVDNQYHGVEQSGLSVVSGQSYTFSIFLKKGTGVTAPDIMQLSFGSSGFPITTYANFNISTPAVTATGAGVSASIVSAGNGWYRCSFTATANATTNSYYSLFFTNNNGSATRAPSYIGLTTSDVFVWGAQFEQKSGATPYQVTTTAAITNYIPQLLTAVANQPRFDFNPVTRQSLGLLMEQQSVNLILQSEDFSTTWAATRAPVSTNINIAPSGALTADTIVANTDNNTHFVSQTFTGTAASHTFTVYAKAYGLNHVALRLFNGATQVGLAYYNLSTGAPGTVTAGTATINSVGNGWYRCALTATLAASASCTADIQLANADNTNSFVGNDVSGVYVWGAQVEATAFPTSYISTGVSAGTRTQDFATITGTNFSSWFNNQQGTVYCSFDNGSANTTSGSYGIWSIDNNINSQGYFTWRLTSDIYTRANNTNSNLGLTLTAGLIIQNSFSYNNTSSGIVAVAVANGITGTSLASATQVPFLLNQLQLARFPNSLTSTGHIRKFAYYPVASTTAQLQALTGS